MNSEVEGIVEKVRAPTPRREGLLSTALVVSLSVGGVMDVCLL